MPSRKRETSGGSARYALALAGVAAVAALAIAGAMGQAVGPVLSGNIGQGTPLPTPQPTAIVQATIGRAVQLDTNVPLGRNPWFGNQDEALSGFGEPFDAVTTRSADGTSFSVSMEIVQGQRVHLNIYLANGSGRAAVARMELNIPTGIDAELADIDRPREGGSNVNAFGGPIVRNVVREARTTASTWTLILGAGAGQDNDDGVTLLLEPKDDIQPGFYSITGRIVETNA